jgi:glycosyltransferase involved in cell wall biosynthesis
MSALIRRNQRHQEELLELVDHFVVLTEAALTRVRANGAPPGKLALNRLGVDRTPQRKPDRQTALPVRIGYLGRFEAVKGVHDLIDAFVGLPRDAPPRLEVRGPARSSEDRRSLAALRRIARSDDRVIFGPEVPRESVSELLESWDILCCPSRSLEGGPTVALEAMAVGTPVIAARIGAMAELMADSSGALFRPGDVRALRAVFERIGADPTATLARWRASLGPVRTMDDVTQAYLALYRA